MDSVFDLILTLSALILFWLPLMGFVIWCVVFCAFVDIRTKELQEDFINGLSEEDRKIVVQYRKQNYWYYRKLAKKAKANAKFYKDNYLDEKH